ncbi:winged helix-turn-helix domain-containing protein [Pandoraea commovens]|uniref:Winged helix-turn-helix domain-containing protein n=1 Tax=Pandoraea commovens TaxID=2508289 RepID=A0ABY5QDI7_9BURK|nr:winged helix-turn-helix domain-containing protein [Pandoraea commovens]UVA78208.1 winged helix-turn-helix domain-containing protein [Pandoraea commovens]
MAKLLIGDAVRFDSDTFALATKGNPNVSLPLGAAAGRCLLVLLEANGEIVTKRAMLGKAWEQYGAVVTSNNLSQAIMQIRRAFEQAGADPSLLVTVPRIGYRLNSVVKVSPFVDASAVESVLPASPVLPIPHFFDEKSQSDSEPENSFPITEAIVREIESDLAPMSPTASATASEAGLPGDIPLTTDGVPALTPIPSDAVVATTSPVTIPSSHDVPPLARHRMLVRPVRTTHLFFAMGLWTIIALASAIYAFRTLPPLLGNLYQHARSGQWVPVPSDETHRYFVTPERAGDAQFLANRVSMIEKEPPKSIVDFPERLVYINGTAYNDLYSYFLCRQPIDRPDANCVSYLVMQETGNR